MLCTAKNSRLNPTANNTKTSYGKTFNLKMRHFKFLLFSDERMSGISHQVVFLKVIDWDSSLNKDIFTTSKVNPSQSLPP